MDKCIHDKGYCEILSDNEVKQPCIEGPCKNETMLLPCPFCGSKNIIIKDSENGVDEKVWCIGCQANIPRFKGRREDLIEAWNRRATCK